MKLIDEFFDKKILYLLKIKNIYLICGIKNIKLKILDLCIYVNVLIYII